MHRIKCGTVADSASMRRFKEDLNCPPTVRALVKVPEFALRRDLAATRLGDDMSPGSEAPNVSPASSS